MRGVGASYKSGGWRHFVSITAVALLAATANAARLGHASYSAAGATPAQRQWNLVCDPPAAVSGSTSTEYNSTVANLDTITAWPGFEITEVNVVVYDDDSESGYDIDTISPAPGTTTVYIVPETDEEGDVVPAAVATGSSTTLYLDGPEIGAVQIAWAPYNPTPVTVEVASAVKTVTPAAGFNRGGPPNFGADVDTHIITFDNVSGNAQQRATFTNYASGNSNFFDYFITPDSYSGPGFNYTASQIASSTVTLGLLQPPPPCPPRPPCKIVTPSKGH